MFESFKTTLAWFRRTYLPTTPERRADAEFADVKPWATPAPLAQWEIALTNVVNTVVQEKPGAEIAYEALTVDLSPIARGLQNSVSLNCGSKIDTVRAFVRSWNGVPRAFTVFVQAAELGRTAPSLIRAVNFYQDANGIAVI